jgi:hypothetical protein
MVPCDGLRQWLLETDPYPTFITEFYDKVGRECFTEPCIVLEQGRLLVDACDGLLWPEEPCWGVGALVEGAMSEDEWDQWSYWAERLYPELCA